MRALFIDVMRVPAQDPELLLMRHGGGQVSSLDIAQYVFWTGDEEGVARAVEEFICKGLMTRERAIDLLREISMGLEYLENSYSEHAVASADGVAPDEAEAAAAVSTIMCIMLSETFWVILQKGLG